MARKFRISVEKTIVEERVIEAENEYMAAAALALESREPVTILGVRMAVGRLPGTKNNKSAAPPKRKPAKKKAPAKKRTPAEQRAINKIMEKARAGKR